MIRWTVAFLIIAIFAAVIGFGGIVTSIAAIGRIVFYIFIVLFVLSFFIGRRSVE